MYWQYSTPLDPGKKGLCPGLSFRASHSVPPLAMSLSTRWGRFKGLSGWPLRPHRCAARSPHPPSPALSTGIPHPNHFEADSRVFVGLFLRASFLRAALPRLAVTMEQWRHGGDAAWVYGLGCPSTCHHPQAPSAGWRGHGVGQRAWRPHCQILSVSWGIQEF